MKIPQNAGDFRLISRRVADALDRCHESNRYMRGLIAWLGFEQTGVEYERRPRVAGESKAPIGSLIVFTLNAFTSFSVKPLRMFVYFGFLLLALSLLGAAVYVLLFLTGDPPAGITTLIVLALLGIGINSLGHRRPGRVPRPDLCGDQAPTALRHLGCRQHRRRGGGDRCQKGLTSSPGSWSSRASRASSSSSAG